MSATVSIDRDGAAPVVRLERPQRLNAINVALLEDLVAALREVAEERVVVLEGAGRAFCVGEDLKETLAPQTGSGTELRRAFALLQEVTRVLTGAPAVFVAAVQGYAVGGGAELALAADLVVGERVFERSRMPASRYHANRLGSRVLSWFVGIPVEDTQCGFRVFRVDALRGLRLNATKYEIETEMLIKVRRRGGRVETVPVTAVYAGQKSKLRPVPDTTRTCFLAVYYRFLERL